MSALTRTPHAGPAAITVGRVDGGYAFWCRTCRQGQAALTGVELLDANVINLLADSHESDHNA